MNECMNDEQWTHHHRTPEIEQNVPSKLAVGILIGYVYLYSILHYYETCPFKVICALFIILRFLQLHNKEDFR